MLVQDTPVCRREFFQGPECFNKPRLSGAAPLGSPPPPPLLLASSGAVAKLPTPSLSCVLASPVSFCPNLPNGVSEFPLDLFCYCVLSEDRWVATRASRAQLCLDAAALRLAVRLLLGQPQLLLCLPLWNNHFCSSLICPLASPNCIYSGKKIMSHNPC